MLELIPINDPFYCCCDTTTTTTSEPTTTTSEPTTTTSEPSCKCAYPFTLDFRTNVVVPITLEINMPRGGSGFPEHNLSLKSYIHGCHDINTAYCYAPNNTLRTVSCPEIVYNSYYISAGTHPRYIYFSIEEPATCDVLSPISIDNPSSPSWSRVCSPHLLSSNISNYLSYIESIYGYLPSFIDLKRNGFRQKFKSSNDFSLEGANGLFTCCNRGILQDLMMHGLYNADKISEYNVKVDVLNAVFSPYVKLKFPFFVDKPAEAWKRGELDNLTLHAPIVLHVAIIWEFRVSVSSIYGVESFHYQVATHNIFVKLLQFPFSGGSVDLDHHAQCIDNSADDYQYKVYYGWTALPPDASYKPLDLDDRTRLSILFPDILNAVENMRATLHLNEITPNPAHSEDGTIDWEFVYKGRLFHRIYSTPDTVAHNPYRSCLAGDEDDLWLMAQYLSP